MPWGLANYVAQEPYFRSTTNPHIGSATSCKQFNVEPNPDDGEDDGRRRVARASGIFNVAQVDNFVIETLPEIPPLERHARADAFIAATGADIPHGGEQAYYKPSTDPIQMPDELLFHRADTRTEDYYSIRGHELTHYAEVRIMPTGREFPCERCLR